VKKILIIDESAFSQVCSAILELEGYQTETMKNFEGMFPKLRNNKFVLIITSYPFGHSFFEKIGKIDMPTIVLTDHINRDVVNLLESLTNSYCMIKPIDYDRFRSLVNEIVSCRAPKTSEYHIL